MQNKIKCEICNFLYEENKFPFHLKKHNKDVLSYNLEFNSEKEIYCIICKKLITYKKFMSNCYKCNCEKNNKTKEANLLRKSLGINNYVSGAHKREKDLRETILPNGLTRKEEISLKTSPILSKIMKDKILKGEFTPCITNSWANSKIRINYNGKEYKFRSAWEGIFWCLHKNLDYEKIRIKYKHENKDRIYITDFYDKENKIIYEIKPSNLKIKDINLNKEKYAIDWCKSNNHKFQYIDSDYFYSISYLLDDNILLNNDKLIKCRNGLRKQIEKQQRNNRHPIVDEILDIFKELKD